MNDGDKKRLSCVIKHYDDVDEAERLFRCGKPTNFSDRKLDREFSTVFANLEYNLLNNGAKALDVGCAGGRYVSALMSKDIDSIGLDTGRSALIYGSKRIPNAKFIQANAADLPFKKETFDLVISIELFYLLTDRIFEKVLMEISRVTKPGGYFVFDLKNKLNPILYLAYKKNDNVRFTMRARTIKEMVRLLEKVGFEIIKEKGIYFPIPPFAPFVIIFAKKK